MRPSTDGRTGQVVPRTASLLLHGVRDELSTHVQACQTTEEGRIGAPVRGACENPQYMEHCTNVWVQYGNGASLFGGTVGQDVLGVSSIPERMLEGSGSRGMVEGYSR